MGLQDAAEELLYVPATQGVQEEAPGPLKVPAGQGTAVVLVDPGGHVYPAAHTPAHPAVALNAPDSVPNCPLGHAPHVDCMLSAVNRPGGHSVHGASPPEPYRPLGHMLFVYSAIL